MTKKRFGRTDRQTNITVASLRYAKHRTVKTERQNIGTADIVGIAKVPITYRFKKTQSTHHHQTTC